MRPQRRRLCSPQTRCFPRSSAKGSPLDHIYEEFYARAEVTDGVEAYALFSTYPEEDYANSPGASISLALEAA